MNNSKTDEQRAMDREYYMDRLYDLYQDRLDEHNERYENELENWTERADMVINSDLTDLDGIEGDRYINTEIEEGRSEGLLLDVYNGNIEYWTDVMEECDNPYILEYVAKCSQDKKATNVGELLQLLITTPKGLPISGNSTTGPALDTPTLNSDTMIAALRKLDVSKANNNKHNNNLKALLPKKQVTKKKRGGAKSRSVKRVFKYY
jgi:hypothetical protein